jgi:hypothetical protein
MGGKAGKVLAVLVDELLRGAEHDRWCSSALTASRAQREAERCSEDVHGRHLESWACSAAGLATEPERASLRGAVIRHRPSLIFTVTGNHTR